MDNFSLLVYGWIGIGVTTLIFLLASNIRIPYGRHTSSKWGNLIDNRLGWFIMELPALIIFPVMAVTGPAEKNEHVWLLVALWIAHYAHRAIIFPLRIHTKGKKMPLVIMLSAIVFNIINGFLNGYFVGYLYQPENPVSIFDLNILFGLILFISGAIINNMADTKLIALRKGNNEYQVPKGWLFEYISCPNHFGEIIAWIGFALVAWNLPALSFAVWTCCNLIPRALNHHQWYSENFQEYPSQRKAVIPFVW